MRPALLLPLALCAVGAALIALALRQSARARETRAWTRITGRVVESRLEEEHGGPEEQGWPRFRFRIRYAYEARGRARESDQVYPGSRLAPASQDREWHQRWVDRFPAGREVEVWVDPADPSRAVLARDAPGGRGRAAIALGGALLAGGLLLLARALGR